MSSSKLEKVCGRCDFTQGVCLDSDGNSGGLGLWWKDLNVLIIYFSRHHIATEIRN